MGIQPLDLQVMYQQSANVSKIAASSQAAQLAESINQQTNIVQNNLEESRRVHQSSDEKTKVGERNSNGQGYSGQRNDKKERTENDNSSENSDAENLSSDSGKKYLGTIIDIVG